MFYTSPYLQYFNPQTEIIINAIDRKVEKHTTYMYRDLCLNQGVHEDDY